MAIILSSNYLGNIDYYTVLNENEEVEIDQYEYFRKQSYRNRAVIHGANGALNLIIPLVKRTMRTPVKDVQIDNTQRWQHLHWRSLESAYRSSPYFEFFEDELRPFYERKYDSLLEFNTAIQDKLMEILGIETVVKFTDSYKQVEEPDYREIIHPKKSPSSYYKAQPYTQVFSDRNGFIPNMSIVDLLFNEGANAISFL